MEVGQVLSFGVYWLKIFSIRYAKEKQPKLCFDMIL